MVLIGLVTACLLAGSPIFLSPSFKKATIEGVVLRPSLLAITTGSFPSITETQELVVPKSIPIILLIMIYFFCCSFGNESANSWQWQKLKETVRLFRFEPKYSDPMAVELAV